FAFEAGVDEDDVGYGEGHAEGPPGETDGQRVRAGDGTGESDVAIGACGCGEQGGIDAPACAGEHEEEIERGGEECFDRLLVAIEEPDAGERGENSDGNDEGDGVAVVVVETGGANSDGGDQADDGEQDQDQQERIGEAAGALG